MRTPTSSPVLLGAVSLVVGLTVALVVGCSVVLPLSPTSGQASSAPPAPSPSVLTPEPSGSTSTTGVPPSRSSSASPSGRPTQAIPSVKPRGFTSPPAGTGLTGYLRQRVSWSPCQQGLVCARVKVPLDYAKPQAQAITLALAKKPSTAAQPKGDLFINPGGPGGSGVDFAGYFRSDDLRAFNIIGWDPRGVGESTPVECFGGGDLEQYTAMDNSPDTAAERKIWLTANTAFGSSCLAESGALLAHVSTEETVRDLDLLRQLLGQPKLDYFGFSYGTQIGALYADLFPQQVGRMVLDGAVNISGKPGVTQAEGFDRSLGDFATWAGKRKTRLGSDKKQVLASVQQLLIKLDQDPVPGGRRSLTQALALTGILQTLYGNEDNYKYLAAGIERALYDNDGQILLFFADQYNQRDRDGDFGQFNYSFPAVRCLDTDGGTVAQAYQDAREVEKQAPTIGEFLGPDLLCPTWPVAPRKDANRKITAAGAAPIVVIGNTGDPATPYEYAENMARQLSSGVLVTLKGEGHLSYDQSACIRARINPYLLDGTVPANGTTCP